MATVFKFYDGTNTLDLTGSDIKLDHAYLPQYATPPGDGTIPPDVIETVPVIITPTSADNLSSIIQNVDLLRRNAARYMQEPDNETPVWWHQKLDGETGERRALAKSIRLALERNPYTAAPPVTQMIKGTLVVTRHPYWERTASRTMPASTPAAAAAVIYDYTSAYDVAADVPARIENLHMTGNVGVLLWENCWIGLRSAIKHGTLANFANIWECEDGTNEGIAADIVDAPSSGGNYVEGTPTGSDTWEKYFTIEMQDAGVADADADDNLGRFLWLLRTKLSAADTFEVQLRFGYSAMADADFILGPTVPVTSTSWFFKEMGSATIPLPDSRPFTWLSTKYQTTWAIQVWAQRTSGAGKIHWDCFCPIPLDEGYLIMKNLGAALNEPVNFSEAPINIRNVLVRQITDKIERYPEFQADRFRLPIGDGRMYVCHELGAGSSLSSNLVFNAGNIGTFYERWIGFRGAQ